MVDRYRGKKGGFGSLSEKNYYEMKKRAEERANRKKKKEDAKKPVNVRDRSNTSRVGVGTIDKKPTPTVTPKKQTTTSKTPIQQERTTQNATQKTTPDKTTAVKPSNKSNVGETQEERAARFRIENKARIAAAAEKGAAQRAKVKKFVTGIGSSISGKFKELQAKEKARLEAQKAARLAKAEEKRKAQLKVTQEREKKRQEKAEIEANRPETLTEKNIRLQREKSEQNRKRFSTFKKGGLVKKKTAAKKTTRKPAARVAKKGIDGVALRGKTRAVRSR